jgi:carbonic anhydrase
MPEIDLLLTANQTYASAPRGAAPDKNPARKLAVVTCMDVRIDPLAVFGLTLGDAHVIRNAGGRLTDDVIRSLGLSAHALGVETVVVMQHTKCGLTGVTDDELRRLTGAGADVDFLSIADHEAALREDVQVLTAKSFLGPIKEVAGLLYDVDTGAVEEVVRWERA